MMHSPLLRPAQAALALMLALLAGMPAPPAEAQTTRPVTSEIDWSSLANDVAGFPGVAIFEMPRVAAQTRLVERLSTLGDYRGAIRVLNRLIERHPYVGEFYATRALLLATEDSISEAVEDIDTALDLGWNELGAIRRMPVFNALSTDPGFRDVTARSRERRTVREPRVLPLRIAGQSAPVARENTRWLDDRQRLQSVFEFSETIDTLPPFATGASAHRDRLNARVAEGRAAGLDGVVYDNRDGGHSTLQREDFPQLSFVDYGEDARAQGLDYGLNNWMSFGAIVIGNSSTARTGGRFWRSQPRLALTEPEGPWKLAQLYSMNHLYVYPEHRDHDPVAEGGQGDLFPANTPFYVVTQGSSGSDQPFLGVIAEILAAMEPRTRAALRTRGELAPAVQMVLRRGLKGVDDDRLAYMSAAAHPTVFPRDRLNPERHVEIAERLRTETMPPTPLLRVLNDFDVARRQDYFGDGLSEVLFDTPFSIARLWRSAQHTRRITVAAGGTTRMGRDVVRYQWRLLRGDPEAVKIQELDEAGTRAVITFDWQTRRPVPGEEGMTSDRVDIAVFADTGLEISAPAFISVLFPSRQERVYEDDGRGGRRLVSIDYDPEMAPEIYSDPLLFPPHRWRDARRYAEDGRLLGWTRRYDDGREEEYTEQGHLVLERDASGRPSVVQSVRYPLTREADGTQTVVARPTDQLFDYVYTDDVNPFGVLLPRTGARSGSPAGAADN